MSGYVNPTSGAGSAPQPKPASTPPPMLGSEKSGLANLLNKDPEFAAKFNAGIMRDMQSQMDHQKRYHEQQEAFRKEQNPQ